MNHSLLEYEAALSTAALADVSDLGKILFSGPERREFLQGLVTNDLSRLDRSRAVPACLLTAKGKLTADFWLFDRGDDILALSLDPSAAPRVLDALSRHFPLSDTMGRDAAGEMAVFLLTGPRAALVMEKALGRPVPDGAVGGPAGEPPSWTFRTVLFGVEGFLLSAPAARARGLWQACEAAGADLGLKRMGRESLEMFRVESGLPRFGVDMDGDTYPIEANLDGHVSYDKGCYLGQETTARLKYKGRPPRRLTALRTDAPASPGDKVEAEGRVLGTVTSAVPSPRLGAALAMSLLPVEESREGRPVLVGGRPGTVVSFPRRIDSMVA